MSSPRAGIRQVRHPDGSAAGRFLRRLRRLQPGPPPPGWLRRLSRQALPLRSASLPTSGGPAVGPSLPPPSTGVPKPLVSRAAAPTPRIRPIRAPNHAVEAGELLSCIPGLAHPAEARDNPAAMAPKRRLTRATPMIDRVRGRLDDGGVRAFADDGGVAAPTRWWRPGTRSDPGRHRSRLRLWWRSGSCCRAGRVQAGPPVSGSGSGIDSSTATGAGRSRPRRGDRLRSGGRIDRRLGSAPAACSRLPPGQRPQPGAPPAHAARTSSMVVPLAAARAAAERRTRLSGVFKAAATVGSRSLTVRDLAWVAKPPIGRCRHF